MHIPVVPLEGAEVEESITSADLEQPVRHSDPQPGHVGLVSPVSHPIIQRGDLFLLGPLIYLLAAAAARRNNPAAIGSIPLGEPSLPQCK